MDADAGPPCALERWQHAPMTWSGRAVEAAVEVAYLLGQAGNRALHHEPGDDLPDRQGPYGGVGEHPCR